MQKYRTNDEVISAFLDQAVYRGMNYQESISFRENKLYSYRALLAELDTTNNALFIDSDIRHYSVTTAKQTTYLVRQANNLTIYSHPLGAKPEVIMSYYWKQVEERILSYLRARTKQSKDMHKHCMHKLLDEARSYADYINLDKRLTAWRYQNKITQQMFKYKLL